MKAGQSRSTQPAAILSAFRGPAPSFPPAAPYSTEQEAEDACCDPGRCLSPAQCSRSLGAHVGLGQARLECDFGVWPNFGFRTLRAQDPDLRRFPKQPYLLGFRPTDFSKISGIASDPKSPAQSIERLETS